MFTIAVILEIARSWPFQADSGMTLEIAQASKVRYLRSTQESEDFMSGKPRHRPLLKIRRMYYSTRTIFIDALKGDRLDRER